MRIIVTGVIVPIAVLSIGCDPFHPFTVMRFGDEHVMAMNEPDKVGQWALSQSDAREVGYAFSALIRMMRDESSPRSERAYLNYVKIAKSLESSFARRTSGHLSPVDVKIVLTGAYGAASDANRWSREKNAAHLYFEKLLEAIEPANEHGDLHDLWKKKINYRDLMPVGGYAKPARTEGTNKGGEIKGVGSV